MKENQAAKAFDDLIKQILYDNYFETNKKKKLTEEELRDYITELISVYMSPLHFKRK